MENQPRQGLRALALLLVPALLIAACTSSGEQAESVPLSDACEEINEREDLAPTLAALCNNEALEALRPALGELRIEDCSDGSTPRVIFRDSEEGQESTAFFKKMMVRFQRVDSLDPDGVGYRPVLDEGLSFADRHQVWVLDDGDHGEFVSQVVAEMLGVGAPEPLDLTKVGSQVTTINAQQPTAPVVNVALPIVEAGELTFTTEDLVAGTLEAISSAGVAHEGMIINLSLAAYTCNRPPARLQEAMEVLMELGVEFSAAAGNDEESNRAWPAAFGTSGSLEGAVWGVGSTDADETIRSCFSNHGTWVETWLPGEEVQTDLGTWSGTSFAAPQAAATLAAGGDPNDNHGTTPPNPTAMFNVTTDINGNQVAGMTSCSPQSGYLPGYLS